MSVTTEQQPVAAPKTTAKPKATRKRKPTPLQLASAQEAQPIKLAQLEDLIVAELTAKKQQPTAERLQELGGPVVQGGKLQFYTAARYGSGDWVSAAVLKRIAERVTEAA